jgi:hypothetical protein
VSMSDSEDQAAVYDKDADSATKTAPAITYVEKDLTNLVRKFSAVVNNKATNKVWKEKKDAAWDSISKVLFIPKHLPTARNKAFEDMGEPQNSKYEVNDYENVRLYQFAAVVV